MTLYQSDTNPSLRIFIVSGGGRNFIELGQKNIAKRYFLPANNFTFPADNFTFPADISFLRILKS